MEKDSKETRVHFRVWLPQEGDAGGTVIALFLGTAIKGWCSSYEHVGQHGPAEIRGVIKHTRPATPEEYAGLARELERHHGYKLRIEPAPKGGA